MDKRLREIDIHATFCREICSSESIIITTSGRGRLLLLELCPGVVELGEDELGDVLVVGAHLLVGVHGQARLPIHLLDVVVSDQLQ